MIDADSTEDVLDAFVVHGHEKHAWPYSQEAIRNYMRITGCGIHAEFEKRADIAALTESLRSLAK